MDPIPDALWDMCKSSIESMGIGTHSFSAKPPMSCFNFIIAEA